MSSDVTQAIKDVYIYKAVTLTVTGVDVGITWLPPVSTVTIKLEESKIPEVWVIIDPAHLEGDPVTPGTAGTLDKLQLWTIRAQKYAVDPTSRATLKIQRLGGPGVEDESIELKDWLVIGAGMTGVSATGQFSLELQLQHPIGLLDRSPAYLGNLNRGIAWHYAQYKDPVDGLIRAYRALIADDPDKRRVPPKPINQVPSCSYGAPHNTTLEQAFLEAEKQIKTKVDELEKYLEWKKVWPGNTDVAYSDLPLGDTCFADADWKRGVQKAITPYADFKEASIWSVVSNVFLADWQLALIPTFWNEKLQVIPFSPWGKPSITVYDDEISDINFPGVDAAPVGGVRVQCSPSLAASDLTDFHDSQDVESQTEATDVIYLPGAAFKSGKALGRIISMNIPMWLPSTLHTAAAYAQEEKGFVTPETTAFVTGEDIQEGAVVPTGGSTAAMYIDRYVGAVYRTAHQFFLSSFRQQIEARFSTRLMFKSKNSLWDQNYVVPGCVVRLESSVEDKVFLDMYVTSITHVISAGASKAYTEWTGRYCRPKVGFPEMAVNGDYNPIYLKN